MAPDTVEFANVTCVGATDKAILVRFEDRQELVWIPQACVHDDSEVYQRGHHGTLVLQEWWAIKNGLI